MSSSPRRNEMGEDDIGGETFEQGEEETRNFNHMPRSRTKEADLDRRSQERESIFASNDPLALSNSDQPGAQLVPQKLDGTNFLSWSRNVKLALGAKIKLGFIDGSCRRPALGSSECARWTRADHMVRCWLLNSMEGRISESFIYVDSAFQLWEELVERFGQANGLLLYQLKRTLSKFEQGSMSVGEYYSRLKKLWDELKAVRAVVDCDCGIWTHCACEYLARKQEQEGHDKLMDFLMGLNDEFDGIRGNIIAMDPLPTVNKAYGLVQQAEKQKSITASLSSKGDSIAMSVNSMSGRQQQQYGKYFLSKEEMINRGLMNKDSFRKGKDRFDRFDGKGERKCEHCLVKGHTKERCYKLIGYPDNWRFNDKNEYRNDRKYGEPDRRYGDRRANAAEMEFDTPFDSSDDGKEINFDPKMIAAMCQEMAKMFKGKGSASNSGKGHAANSANKSLDFTASASSKFSGPYL